MKMKTILGVCLLLTLCSGSVDSVRSPGRPAIPMVHLVASLVESATACNSVSLANQIVIGCFDGRNVSDSCCASVFSTLGRGVTCLCQVKSEPLFRFSSLVGQGAMENLLRRCHAAPAMHDMLSSACDEPTATPPSLPAARTATPAGTPSPPSLPAASTATPTPAGTPSQSHHSTATPPSLPAAPRATETCSRHMVVSVLGWVCAGVVSFILFFVVFLCCRERKKYCRHCCQIQMIQIPRNTRAGNNARPADEENDSAPLNSQVSDAAPLSPQASDATAAVEVKEKRVRKPNQQFQDYICN